MSDNGLIILNITIISRKNHLEKYFLNNNLNENIIMVDSNTRYNNYELSFYWLKNFNKNTSQKKRNVKNIFDR